MMPADVDDELEKLKWLIEKGKSVDPEFREVLTQITDTFNSATQSVAAEIKAFGLVEEAVCAGTGISAETYQKMRHLSLRTELRNPKLQVEPGKPEILASLKFGPLKTIERAGQKVAQFGARQLYDLNRATVQFHNPLALLLY